MSQELQPSGSGIEPIGIDRDPLSHSASRRALLRAGTAAAPVLLTLASGPVSAANGCVVASSFISVTTFKSRNAGATKILNCASTTCETWQNQCGWGGQPWSTYTAGTLVKTALGTTGSTYDDWTINAMFGSAVNTTSEFGVVQHVLAMYLNAKYYGTVFPGMSGTASMAYLAGVWTNYKSHNNTYVVPGALSWDTNALITWLRDLMGQSF